MKDLTCTPCNPPCSDIITLIDAPYKFYNTTDRLEYPFTSGGATDKLATLQFPIKKLFLNCKLNYFIDSPFMLNFQLILLHLQQRNSLG